VKVELEGYVSVSSGKTSVKSKHLAEGSCEGFVGAKTLTETSPKKFAAHSTRQQLDHRSRRNLTSTPFPSIHKCSCCIRN
jgi:hypothetical protein